MWVWLLMLFSIIVIRFLIPDALGEKKKNLIFLGLSFAIIVFVVGSRSPQMSGSSDLYNYYRWYGRAMTWSLDDMLARSAMEDGYMVLNKILVWIVPWDYFILYFEAAFCTFVMFWYIYRNADSVFLSVIIYVCLGPWQFFLTGFRQAFAISICYIAFELMKKHRTVYDLTALGCIALAATLHSTAWVFISAFFIRRLKMTKKFVVGSVAMTLILLVCLQDILDFGRSVMGKDYEMEYVGNVFGGLIPIAVYILALSLTYLIWKSNKAYLNEYGFEVSMLTVGLCLYTLRYSSLIMERVSFYFTPVISIALANGITRQKTKTVRNVVYILCIAMCIGLYIYRSIEQYGDYHSFWEYLELVNMYSPT